MTYEIDLEADGGGLIMHAFTAEWGSLQKKRGDIGGLKINNP